jgi:hypothetical protein
VGDCHLPLDQAAFTVGLGGYITANGSVRSQIRNDELIINPNRVCRLHLRGSCKYGKDCKNIHLCSKLGENFVLRPAVPSERQSLSSNSSRRSSIGHTPKDLTPHEAAALVIHDSFSQVVVPPPDVKKESETPSLGTEDSCEQSFREKKLEQGRERHCFGDELDDPESKAPETLDFSFDTATMPTFPQRWGGSPVPCFASASLRQMVAC